MSIETMKELVGIGFTPMNIVLMIAVITLAGWFRASMKSGFKKQDGLRESWHADTRAELQAAKDDAKSAKEHAEECKQDREEIRVELAEVRGEMRAIGNCPVSQCPNRKAPVVIPSSH